MKKAYFYSENADQFTFFRVPKILFTDEYINISSDAKLLYGMLLDRMSLSLGRHDFYSDVGEGILFECQSYYQSKQTARYRRIAALGGKVANLANVKE